MSVDENRLSDRRYIVITYYQVDNEILAWEWGHLLLEMEGMCRDRN